jgi:hypothetical protein
LGKLELWSFGREFAPGSLLQTLKTQLELFIGSLYLCSYQYYTKLCDRLGLIRATATAGQQTAADGFIIVASGKWGLTGNPVPFPRQLLLMVTKEGKGVDKTHLGRILHELRLEERDLR